MPRTGWHGHLAHGLYDNDRLTYLRSSFSRAYAAHMPVAPMSALRRVRVLREKSLWFSSWVCTCVEQGMKKNLVLICIIAAVGVTALSFLVRTETTALAAQRAQTGKPVAQGAEQNPGSLEERRLVVLRLGKNSEGEIWEASFLDLPDNASEVRTKLGDTGLIAKIKAWGGTRVTVETSPDVSSRAVEETLLAMAKAGIQNIFIVGPYIFHGGRLYFTPSQDTGVSEPELAVDKEQLRELALACGLMDKAYQWPNGKKALIFELLIDEAGKLVGMRLGTPLDPKIEANLAPAIRVVAPARRGTGPVPGVAMVRIDVK